jgi:hypothetical protein
MGFGMKNEVGQQQFRFARGQTHGVPFAFDPEATEKVQTTLVMLPLAHQSPDTSSRVQLPPKITAKQAAGATGL